MTTSNEEFLFFYTEIERQIKQVFHEPNDPPHLAPGEILRQPKVLDNDESTMRSHAARCEAGR
jgi:hypothetical protein